MAAEEGENVMGRSSPKNADEIEPLVVVADGPPAKRERELPCSRWSNGTNRWTRLFLALCLFLLISGFVLLWSDQDYSSLKFYYDKPAKFPNVSNAPKALPAESTTSLPTTTTESPFSPTTRPPLPYHTQKPVQETPFLANWTHFDKFMLTDVGEGACGGVANMIFRLASLYGIGKQVNRTACLQGACAQEYHIELYSMYPNLQKFPLLTQCWPQESKGVGFAGDCWRYDDVNKLKEHNETLINLHTSYLQSHRFFHYARKDILFMFNFSSGMNEMVDAYAQHLFDNDNSTKVCVHMRRGDFNGAHPLLPSETSFVVPAMEFLIRRAMEKQTTPNVDVVLLSDDVYFANDIRAKIKNLKLTDKVFVPRELNRIENMNLAARHCDLFLVSSSGSTFGWWMAYLMPDEKQKNVFYNSLFFKPQHASSAASFVEGDFFPPEWNRLVLDEEKKEVFVQDRSIPLKAA